MHDEAEHAGPAQEAAPAARRHRPPPAAAAVPAQAARLLREQVAHIGDGEAEGPAGCHLREAAARAVMLPARAAGGGAEPGRDAAAGLVPGRGAGREKLPLPPA